MNEKKKNKTDEMQQMRCGNCNKLLAKTGDNATVQIKCPRCKTLNQK